MAEVLSGFAIFASFLFALLPLLIGLWLVSRVAQIGREVSSIRRQVAVIAEHVGAEAVHAPEQRRSSGRWWMAMLAVVVVLLLLLPVGYELRGGETRQANLLCKTNSRGVEVCEPAPVPQ